VDLDFTMASFVVFENGGIDDHRNLSVAYSLIQTGRPLISIQL
jgi:hypothetical protein